MQKQKGLTLNLSKGFTIIELVAVILIIVLLAGIIMANVSKYINKSKDSAIQENLSTLMSKTTEFYLANGAYYNAPPGDECNVCSCSVDSTRAPWTAISSALTSIGVTTDKTCQYKVDTWCASVVLKGDSSKEFCVDSTGVKKIGTSTLNSGTGTGHCYDHTVNSVLVSSCP